MAQALIAAFLGVIALVALSYPARDLYARFKAYRYWKNWTVVIPD